MISLLLLLGLFAGGAPLASPAMPIGAGEQAVAASDMKDMVCKACGKQAAGASCEALCIALPAVAAAPVELRHQPSRVNWSWVARSGPTHIVIPDSSPPRA